MKVKVSQWILHHSLPNKCGFLFQNVRVLIHTAIHGSQLRISGANRYPIRKLSAFVRVRNEGRFILEWISHYRLLGFEHFYIYDNGSTDATRVILEPLIHMGVVTYVYWPTQPITPSAEIDFFKRFGTDSRWVAFFDSDEFLELRTSSTLLELLEKHNAPALAINWRLFGSSWYTSTPDGLVLRNFQYCARNLDRHVKVIVRPDQIVALRNPHNFYYRHGKFARTIDGMRAFGSFAYGKDDSSLVLRHFMYRGTQDFLRKASDSYSATQLHHQRRVVIWGTALNSFNNNNDIYEPFDDEHIKQIEQLMCITINREILPAAIV